MATLEQIVVPVPTQIARFTDAEALAIAEQDQLLAAQTGKYEGTTTYCGIPIRQEHSIRSKARNIIRHNYFSQVTRIMADGKTGSGKTTFDTNLIHEIHTIAETEFDMHYNIQWLKSEKITHFVEFIESLPKGVDYIFVFEDASFTSEFLKKYEKLKIKKVLTEVRHILGDPHLIFFFNIHYSKALDKMMRDADFKVFTSISDEERPNVLQLLGWENQDIIDTFEYRYRGMLLNGWFTVQLKDKLRKQYVYHTNRPFRIALYSDLGVLHFVLYASYKSLGDKVACALCINPEEKHDFKEVSEAAFYEEFTKTYGSFGQTIIGYYLYFNGQKDAINSKAQRGINFIHNFRKTHMVDLARLNEVHKAHRKQLMQRVWTPKKETERLTRAVENNHFNRIKNSKYDVAHAESAFRDFISNIKY